MAEAVVYKHSVEAFISQVVLRHGLLSLDFEKELRALGCDVTRPQELPKGAWLEILKATARRFRPGVDEATALEAVGREVVRGYAEGLVGRGLFVLLRLLGPRRALLRISENYRTADSFTEAVATELGPAAVDVEFNDVGDLPHYIVGILKESLALLKVKDGRVDFRALPSGNTLYEVRWS